MRKKKTAATNIAKWNGSSWTTLGSGTNGAVFALATFDDGTGQALYAGGSFTASTAAPAKRIARWDGVSWSTVGVGFTNGNVAALAATPSTLYAAGTFTNGAAPTFAQVAKWDGASWSGLGSGLLMSPVTPTGNALTLLGNDIYLGGLFIFAGDKPSMFIARWNNQLNFYPPPNLSLTRSRWVTNGQFQFRVSGTSGQTYVLQGSTNLTTWTPLLTNTIPLYDFTDTNAAALPKRFYRGLLAP